MIKDLSLKLVRLDGGTQSRECLDEDRVKEYAADKLGTVSFPPAIFPPAIVFWDKVHYWLADGFTRYWADMAAGFDTIRADVRAGTRWDAVLYAAGANAEHGQRRSRADKQRQILMVLSNPAWFGRTNRWIAEHVRVDDKTVARVRRDIIEGSLALFDVPEAVAEFRNSEEVSRTGADGKKYKAKKSKQRDEDEDDIPDEEAKPDFLLPGEEDYTPAPQLAVDELGVLVPAGMKGVFAARWHFDRAMHLVGQLDDAMRSAVKSDGGHYLTAWLEDEGESGHVCGAVAEVAEILTRCRPHSVTCGQCKNRRENCQHCGGKHFDCRPEL